ncbi:hypothetical protein E4U40_000432, partial [Claviceps sp. LM458 group G5]
AVVRRTVREMGCSWWTGANTNVNAKVRKRSTGEMVMKVPKYKAKVAPWKRV